MYNISFIFKLNNDQNIQYGKILLNHFNNNHTGLDIEIKKIIKNVINSYMKNNSLPRIKKLHIGVIAILNELCSTKEKNIFSIYIDCSNPDWTKHIYYCFGEKGIVNYNLYINK